MSDEKEELLIDGDLERCQELNAELLLNFQRTRTEWEKGDQVTEKPEAPRHHFAPRKVIAFDYGGTLRVSDGIADLRDIVAGYNLSDVGIVVIGDCPANERDAVRKEIEELKDSMGRLLVFKAIELVHSLTGASLGLMREVAEEKVRLMQKHRARAIYEDDPEICRVITECGLTAIQVSQKN